jgi:predicted nucleic acid-binding protein
LIVYADTGFLISLYGQDANSAAAIAVTQGKPVFLLTPLGEAEFINGVELRVFRKQWTRQEARAALADFLHDQGAGVFQMESFSSEVWQTAWTLSRRHTAKLGIRTLDLLQVAAVKVFKPDAFYTFDQRQRNLARAERLRVMPA